MSTIIGWWKGDNVLTDYVGGNDAEWYTQGGGGFEPGVPEYSENLFKIKGPIFVPPLYQALVELRIPDSIIYNVQETARSTVEFKIKFNSTLPLFYFPFFVKYWGNFLYISDGDLYLNTGGESEQKYVYNILPDVLYQFKITYDNTVKDLYIDDTKLIPIQRYNGPYNNENSGMFEFVVLENNYSYLIGDIKIFNDNEPTTTTTTGAPTTTTTATPTTATPTTVMPTTTHPGTFFERPNGHPEVIDNITPAVQIARGNTQGIYNAAVEESYTREFSPEDTEWSPILASPVVDPTLLSYNNWEDAVLAFPPGMVNNYIYMHIISEGRYFEFYFLSWTPGGGGGFSYIRNEITGAPTTAAPTTAMPTTAEPTTTLEPTTTTFAPTTHAPIITATVLYTDFSTRDPTGWFWDFGEGATPATATSKGPHIISYSSGGTKTVLLTTSNEAGSNTRIKYVVIIVPTTTAEPTTTTAEPTTTEAPIPAPVAEFKWHEQGVGVYGNLQYQYLVSSGNIALKDFSTGGIPTSWSWEAWNYITLAYDVISSISEFVFLFTTWYPTYMETNYYSYRRLKIRLTVTNAEGTDTKEYTINWAIPTYS